MLPQRPTLNIQAAQVYLFMGAQFSPSCPKPAPLSSVSCKCPRERKTEAPHSQMRLPRS